MGLRRDERLLLKRLLNRHFETRLVPLEQAELRELLVRFNPHAAALGLSQLIDLGHVTLGMDAIERIVVEKEKEVASRLPAGAP
jgi:hypothetical protein